ARNDRRRADERRRAAETRRRARRHRADAALQGRRRPVVPRSLRTPSRTAVPLFPAPGAPRGGRRPLSGDVAQGHSRRGELFRVRSFRGLSLSHRAQRARRPLPTHGALRLRRRGRFAGRGGSRRSAGSRARSRDAEEALVGGDRRAAAAATRSVSASRGDRAHARRDRRGRRHESRDDQEPSSLRRAQAAARSGRRGRADGETRMNGDNARHAAHDDRFPPYAEAGFDEAPPPDIDRAILAEADRVAAQRARWLRPAHLAWAAAVALSIAIVLEVGVGPGVAPDRAPAISEPVTDLGGTAPRDAERASSAAESAELRVAPVRPEAPDADAAVDLAAPRRERFAAPPPTADRAAPGAADAARPAAGV